MTKRWALIQWLRFYHVHAHIIDGTLEKEGKSMIGDGMFERIFPSLLALGASPIKLKGYGLGW